MDLDGYTPWEKSSYSAGSGEACIMNSKRVVGGVVEEVRIGDSKDPSYSVVIPVSPAAWSAFVTSV
jgi:hypothetical protein